MLYLMSVSCSDETQSEPTSARSDVGSETILLSEGDSGRVSDYRLESLSSRVGDDATSEPQVPDDAISMEDYDPNVYMDDIPRVLYSGCDLTTTISFKGGGDLYIFGNLTVTSFSSGGGTIYIMSGGSVTLESSYLNRDVTIVCYGELNIPDNFTIANGAYIYLYSSFSSLQSVTVDGYLYSSDSVSLGSLTINNSSGEVYIDGDLDVDGDVKLSNGSLYIGGELSCDELTLLNNATITYGESYELSHIAQIAPHREGISATSIDIKGDYAYVSWHTAESELSGYIDVIDVESLEIVSTLYAADRDFNHIYIGEGEIYTTGDNNKGAFIAQIDYPNSLGEVEIYHRQVEGSSGNSMLVDDDDIWVVTGSDGGVSVINDDAVEIFDPLAYAKYIVRDGDNRLVLAGYPEAKIYSYDREGELLDSYSVGSFYPNDGKNTIAKYGDTTYVALGSSGLKAFENGVNVLTFSEDIGAVNCVAVDEQFCYLAGGVGGFVVLKREDFSPVARHTHSDSSANFVAVGCDGMLYVAYGQQGVNLYTLDRQ